MPLRVVVVGAGVIGLSSAVAILEQIPGCSVTIMSDSFSPDTTGDVAAGMWGPYLPGGTSEEDVKVANTKRPIKETNSPRAPYLHDAHIIAWPRNALPALRSRNTNLSACVHVYPTLLALDQAIVKTSVADPNLIIRWAKVSWDQFQSWYDSGGWGVLRVPGSIVSDTPIPTPSWHHISIGFRRLSEEECRAITPHCVSGYTFTTFIAEPSKFLPKLAELIKEKGGKFEKRRVDSLLEVAAEADVVVNCSGLGARQLVPDPDMLPVRGQVVRVRAPRVTEHLCDESESNFAYILPNNDCVVLGGTLEEGRWSITPDPDSTQAIIRRCTKLLPALKGATVLSSRAGLRPYRKSGVRLEEDYVVTTSGRRVPVVHNYGHAGCGVTLMWGCARDVANKITSLALKSSL